MRDFIGGGFFLGGIACFLLTLAASPDRIPGLILFGLGFMAIGFPIMYWRRR